MGLLDEARGVGNQPAAETGVDPARLQNDPGFQRLAPAAQQRVLSQLGVQAPPQPNQIGTLTAENPVAKTPPALPHDHPIDSAIPGELKKALVDPAYRLLSGRSQGFMQTAGDVIGTGQLVGAGVALATTGPAGAASVLLAPTAGAFVRGILTDFNASQGWSEFLGGLTEMGTGGLQAMSGWRGAMRTARGVIGEARAGGAVAGEGMEAMSGVTRAQRTIGEAVVNRANAALEVRAKPIRQVLDGLETTASKMKVGPDNDAFHDVAYMVDKAREYRVHLPELAKLEKQLADGSVDMKDVVAVRKELESSLSYARSASDPNLPASRRLAREIRGYATNAVSASLGPEAGGRYGEALIAWKSQYRDPQRLIKSITSKNLEPSTAFELTYGPKTSPEILQTLDSLKNVDPNFRQTLRLGAMQHFMAAAGGDLRSSRTGSAAFKQLGPMLAQTGLFSSEELTALHLFMKPNMIDQAMHSLSTLTGGQVGRGIALGLAASGMGTSGSAIFHVVAQHPRLAVAAIAASGGLSALRRVMLAPPGSPVAQAAMGSIARGLMDLGTSLAARPSVHTTE